MFLFFVADASTFTLFTIDVCLVVLFMAQHSGLASSTYRKKMEDWGLSPVTRSFYVLTSSLMLQVRICKKEFLCVKVYNFKADIRSYSTSLQNVGASTPVPAYLKKCMEGT